MTNHEHSKAADRKRTIRRWIIGLILSVLILALLATLFNVKSEDLAVLQPNAMWLLLATLSYIPCMLVRAYRMMHIESAERAQAIGYGPMVWILCVHQSANHVLPMRMGEATYAALLKARSGESAGRSIGVTLLMRCGDLIGLGAMVLCATPFVDFSKPVGEIALYLAGVGTLIFGLGCLVWGHHLIRFLSAPFVRILPPRLLQVRQAVLDGLAEIRTSSKAIFITIWTSIVLWIFIMLMHWLLGKGLGIELSAAEMTVAAAGGVVMSMVPVGSALNLGTVEVGWILSLSLFAPFEEGVALAIGFGVHLGLILATCLFGVIGGWILMRTPNKNEAPTEAIE